MDKNQDILNQSFVFIYGPAEILVNMSLAFLIGLFISYVYKVTHKGLSYSQSFMLTIIFVAFIVAVVMMVIGNNLARAFALVGALSIIRFRTVIKDTKDTAYIFLALATGMASGTSSYFLAISSGFIFAIIAITLHVTNFGSFYKSELLLRFRTISSGEEKPPYSEIISQFARVANLLHVEPSGDAQTIKMTFDILMRKDMDPEEFSLRMTQLKGVSEVALIASKHDVDY